MTTKTRDDDDGLVDEPKLSKPELKALTILLESERHQLSDRIEDIEETLEKIEQGIQEGNEDKEKTKQTEE